MLLATLLAGALATSAPGGPWTRSDTALPAATLALRERTGTWLVADGERLVRRGDPGEPSGPGGNRGTSGELELGCTLPGGTGRILDLAPDPAGPVYVVAERGLFSVGPDVAVTDPLELGEGAPPGKLTSAFVDARRRLWVATDRAIGVLDPFFLWGSTLAGEAAPPAPGPYRLRGDGASLLVSTSVGTWRYTPDLGPGPRVSGLRVDGTEVAAGARLARAHGAEIRVTASASGAGPLDVRWRLDGHHVWRSFDEDQGGGPDELLLSGLDPGTRLLEVIAIDRDLRRSAPFQLELRVAYPFYYAKAFVLGACALATLLVVLLFALRARHAGGAAAWGRAALSAGLVLLFGLQGLAAIFPHAKGWPFVGFTMYTQHYGPFDLVYDEQLSGVRPNGQSFRIPEEAMGIAIDSRWQVLGPLIDEGTLASADRPGPSARDALARDYVARFRKKWPGSRIVAVQAVAQRTRLTAAGPVPVAALVLRHWAEEPGG